MANFPMKIDKKYIENYIDSPGFEQYHQQIKQRLGYSK
jgi:hypothetical protein